MVWPLAKDCSTGLLSASVKLQPTVPVLPVSVVISLTPEVSTKVPIWLALSVKPGRCALEVDDFSVTAAWWVSIKSTSRNVMVPTADRSWFAATESSVSSGAPLLEETTVGMSLVPTSVTVTSWEAPLLRVIV